MNTDIHETVMQAAIRLSAHSSLLLSALIPLHARAWPEDADGPPDRRQARAQLAVKAATRCMFETMFRLKAAPDELPEQELEDLVDGIMDADFTDRSPILDASAMLHCMIGAVMRVPERRSPEEHALHARICRDALAELGEHYIHLRTLHVECLTT